MVLKGTLLYQNVPRLPPSSQTGFSGLEGAPRDGDLFGSVPSPLERENE